MMEKKEGIAVYIYRMQDKRDDKSQSPLFLSRAAARYAFGEGGEGTSKEASFRVEKGLRGKPYFPEYPLASFFHQPQRGFLGLRHGCPGGGPGSAAAYKRKKRTYFKAFFPSAGK